jgi:hypothetical protein
MAERENLFKVEIIKDHSCGSYTVGEIDTVPDHSIEQYIDRFGEFGYTELQNFFFRAIATAHNKIMAKRISEAKTYVDKK